MKFVVEPIGYIKSVYADKFGVPRQPGLVDACTGSLIFDKNQQSLWGLEGLEGFSHIWIQFVFHQVNESHVRFRVRPPRMIGDEKMGVWATRSPFRPNRIGLSVVKIGPVNVLEDSIEIPLFGGDFVDGTPVIDIKPYLAYSDSIVDASEGWIANNPFKKWQVRPNKDVEGFFEGNCEDGRIILESLSLDPRARYQKDFKKDYFAVFCGYEIGFRYLEDEIEVFKVRKLEE